MVLLCLLWVEDRGDLARSTTVCKHIAAIILLLLLLLCYGILVVAADGFVTLVGVVEDFLDLIVRKVEVLERLYLLWGARHLVTIAHTGSGVLRMNRYRTLLAVRAF